METTNTIKGIEVIAYKGMNSDMTCKGFQYELGKSYKTDKVKLCEIGFHACLNPIDVLDYYQRCKSSRYFKVKLFGEITKCGMWDTNVAATEITILEEIPSDKFLTNTEWWKNENVLDLLYYSDGFARIKNCERQYNFINKKGKFLSDEWFIDVGHFNNGLAKVKRKDKYNFIDKYGKYLTDEWFDWVGDFREGFARVQRGNKLWNFINKKGKFLSDEWFNWVDDFKDGFAVVQRDDKLWNFINKKGKYLIDEWFDYLDDFREGFARVQRGDKLYNFINKKGKYLIDEWFDWVGDFQEGFARVQRTNGERAKIDKTGKLIKILQ